MKKSTLFKILTLFLTFVIFTCCSGCYLISCIYNSYKERKTTMKIEKERMRIADTLVPEIDGYIIEAKPVAVFENKEDYEKQGFLKGGDFFREYQTNEYRHEITKLEDGSIKVEVFSIVVVEQNKEYILLDYIIISAEEEKKHGVLFPEFIYCSYFVFNGEPFIVRKMEKLQFGEYVSSGSIAFFLVDFEKHQMYYVGYTKEWISTEIKNERLYEFEEMCFKLTKE